MSRPGFFSRILYKLNILAAILLLLTLPAPFINPQFSWVIALLGLFYPLALFVNFLFLAYWLFRKQRYFLLSLFVILLGIHSLKSTVAVQLIPESLAEPLDEVKIMSYNVQNFDLYNWSQNRASRDEMMKLIANDQPDILCFQEFYTEDDGDFENIRHLVGDLDYPYFHFVKTLSLRGTDHWGMALFSKHPIVDKNSIKFANSDNNALAFADIDVNGKVIRVFNAHLQSIHLGKEDIDYVSSITKNEKKQEIQTDHLKASTSILKKLKDAFQKRGSQADEMAKAIQDSPFPVVVCGDFNDTPSSYTYKRISDGLQDAFLTRSWGFGGTYAGPIPFLRIDYLLVDPKLKIEEYSIKKKAYSDHYPVSCKIAF